VDAKSTANVDDVLAQSKAKLDEAKTLVAAGKEDAALAILTEAKALLEKALAELTD